MARFIRIDTILGLHILQVNATAHDARAIARSWMKKTRTDLGGGALAAVSIAVPGGRWHHVGAIGNRSDFL